MCEICVHPARVFLLGAVSTAIAPFADADVVFAVVLLCLPCLLHVAASTASVDQAKERRDALLTLRHADQGEQT